MTTLRIEIDSRETCFGLVSSETMKLLFGDTTETGVVRLVTAGNSIQFISVHTAPSLLKNILRFDKIFASSLGLVHGEEIACTSEPVRNTPSSQPVIVRPISSDDWEVVESRSEFLESNLLGQIGVVFSGQKFPVWIARGQKPIMLEVADIGAAEFVQLVPDTEIAVEPRQREIKPISSQKSPALHVRVVDGVWPESTPGGIGFIVHDTSRLTSSIVTLRDRPNVVSMVAGSAKDVDIGVVLVSPVIRDKYGLRRGDRIVIESLDDDRELKVPKRVSVFVSEKLRAESDNDMLKERIFEIVKSSGCLVVPQGGWIALRDNEFCCVHLPMDTKIALLTPETFLDTTLEFFTETSSGMVSTPSIPHYMRYIPESVRGGVVREETEIPHPPLPSFVPVVDRISNFFESCLVNSVSSPFVSSVLVLGKSDRSGRLTVASQSFQNMNPRVPFVVVDCATLADPTRYTVDEVIATFTGLLRYAFETPPMGIVLDNIDVLMCHPEGDSPDSIRRKNRGKIFFRHIQSILAEVQPSRSILLIGTASESRNEGLVRLFTHFEALPSLGDLDRDFVFRNIFKIDTPVESSELSCLSDLLDWPNRDLRKQLMSSSQSVVCRRDTPVVLGGLSSQFSQLLDAVTLPLQFPILFPKGRNIVSTGALVVGPSGTGKSALVDWVVRSAGLPVEVVRGPDLLDKYIGASELGVRRVFEKAASIAPAILVFDAIRCCVTSMVWSKLKGYL
jgi:hypothetical protein